MITRALVCVALLLSAVSCDKKAEPPKVSVKTVPRAEKEAFLKMFRELPKKGEAYTEEAIDKAGPKLGVLFALAPGDLKEGDLNGLLTLSHGLVERKENRDYAVKNFSGIAHSNLKLVWAALLFNNDAVSPDVVRYLRKAINSKEQFMALAETVGPEYNEFKKRVLAHPLGSK